MESLKGLILSGGAGTRLRPITHTSAKQLVPVANKPVLFYGIEALVEAGITEIGIVIAPETGDEIAAAAGDGTAFGASITYIRQPEPLGLAHAVLTAEEFLQDGPFVMYLGDNLLRDGITDLVDAFRAHEPDALILLTRVPDPGNFGLVGVYLFGPPIFEAARAIEPSGRGELEITDAIQRLIDGGKQVESRTVTGWWKDTGQLDDMLEANRLVLEDIQRRIEGELVDSKVEGRVVVEAGARLERAVVRGPAIIGANARITDAYVGPYTSIDAGVSVSRAEVEHSILLAGSSVSDLGSRMEASLLGRNVKLSRGDGLPKTLRMIVGDNAEIKIP
jgi:glucose-1-phosphate thymidylyltransferase